MNVGILGHVDAGKTTLATSLAKAISTFESTSAFDKPSKCSKDNLRANTIELGISAVDLKLGEVAGGDPLVIRLTLIDCPGHFAFIRTVLAASSVFDAAICVVNAAKGVEVQTAEHLILASVLCPNYVLVVINKTDLVPTDRVELLARKLPKFLNSMGINAESEIVDVSLLDESRAAEAVKKIHAALKRLYYVPERTSSSSSYGPDRFVMAVDHCFPVKGKGTVATGTVIDGVCRVGMTIQLPQLDDAVRKVRGLQSWKRDVEEVGMGERAALLLPDLSKPDDYKRVGRTTVCAPGTLTKTKCLLASIKRIKQFRHELRQRYKLLIAVGFESATAECHFIKAHEYAGSIEYETMEALSAAGEGESDTAVLKLEQPVHTRPGSMLLAIKMDTQKRNECRLVFHGSILALDERSITEVPIFRRKERRGIVERMHDSNTLICRGLFKKETDIGLFNNMIVHCDGSTTTCRIDGTFGKQGKCRAKFQNGIESTLSKRIESGEEIEVTLRLKVYKGGKCVAY